MRVLVCGGRNYSDIRVVFLVLDGLHTMPSIVRSSGGITKIIEGGAQGADRLARRWAESRLVQFETFRADWSAGRGAGSIRNQEMLDRGKPDLVVAFPDPASRGTWDMVERAKRAEVTTLVIPDDLLSAWLPRW